VHDRASCAGVAAVVCESDELHAWKADAKPCQTSLPMHCTFVTPCGILSLVLCMQRAIQHRMMGSRLPSLLNSAALLHSGAALVILAQAISLHNAKLNSECDHGLEKCDHSLENCDPLDPRAQQ
jgi:hypothetical protein